MSDHEELRQVAKLIDNLKSAETTARVASARALPRVATALGAARTRTELVPFLSESAADDDDDVLLAMAEELANLIEHVGGGEHCACLLGPLEVLATVEESLVRERAVLSAAAVAAAMPAAALEKSYVPLVTRLASRDWFTARISACGMFAVAHARLSAPAQAGLRAVFAKLCKDDTPMVRRVAAANLAALAAECSAEVCQEELVPLFANIAMDDQDSVRLQTVGNCVALASALAPDEAHAKVLPVLLETVRDRSWRVRWSVAARFDELCVLVLLLRPRAATAATATTTTTNTPPRYYYYYDCDQLTPPLSGARRSAPPCPPLHCARATRASSKTRRPRSGLRPPST